MDSLSPVSMSLASSVSYSAVPLRGNRWLFRVYVNSTEITDAARNNGLLHMGSTGCTLVRWAGSCLVKAVMTQAVQEWGMQLVDITSELECREPDSPAAAAPALLV